MNLENLANIGEFIGAAGVVASLVYLSIQILSLIHISEPTRPY